MENNQPEQKESLTTRRYSAQPSEMQVAIFETVTYLYRSQMELPEVAYWLKELTEYRAKEFRQAAKILRDAPPNSEYTGLPHLADFIRVMNSERQRMAENLARKGGYQLADLNCKVCFGTGWMKDVSQGDRVSRCICWRENRKKLGENKNEHNTDNPNPSI